MKEKKAFSYLVISFFALLWFLPIWTSILTAIKSKSDYISQDFWELPTDFHLFENLAEVLQMYHLDSHFFITIIYSVVGAGFAILFGSMAAFSIIRIKPKFHMALFFIIFSGTIFPFQMYLIPLYTYFNQWGIYDTRIGLILVYTAICIPFSLFVFRGYYTTVQKSIQDAAMLDGCGVIRTYTHIFLPLSKSPAAVVALFQMTFIWNDLLFGMVLSISKDIRPIMVALATMSGGRGGSETLLLTGVIFTSIPTVVLYLLLKKYFIKGLALSTS